MKFKELDFGKSSARRLNKMLRRMVNWLLIRVREQCVEYDILALETPGDFLLQQGYKAIIISGGPN
ncbi:hypothetical protein OUZ56_019274 [Daphnia magna]|uniref:Uncharacterized protein n=1 Tax=Daphnia magna TaxID=35525 RepID=A0ABQ9ZB43_9CRUS|nr:hypothetical protein OUZ56_019274 [Daphnia magna]